MANTKVVEGRNAYLLHSYNDDPDLDFSFSYYKDEHGNFQIKMYHRDLVKRGFRYEIHWCNDGNITPDKYTYDMIKPGDPCYAYLNKELLNCFESYDILNELESYGLIVYMKTEKFSSIGDEEYHFVLLTNKFLEESVNLDAEVYLLSA